MNEARAPLYVEGIGLWAPQLPGWREARAILRGEAPPPLLPAARPTPAILPATERRRAPDAVAIAVEVATAACASAAREPRSLPGVFASTYGDLVISDYMCATLAQAPLDVSPTRFHHSVHNAAAGYWSIATEDHEAYTAITADRYTFGAGLLTAATHARAEHSAVLLVAYDIEGRGPLASQTASRGMLGSALVLAPQPTPRSCMQLAWRIAEAAEPRASSARAENAALVAGNAMADCLVLFETLADEASRRIVYPLSTGLVLELDLSPVAPTG